MSRVSLMAGGVALLAFAASAVLLAGGAGERASTLVSPPAATPSEEPTSTQAQVRPKPALEETPRSPPRQPVAAPAPDDAPPMKVAGSPPAAPLPPPSPTWEEEEELPDPEAEAAAVDAANLVLELMKKRAEAAEPNH